MAGVNSQLSSGTPYLGGTPYAQLSGTTPHGGSLAAAKPVNLPGGRLESASGQPPRAATVGSTEDPPSHSIEQIAGEIEVALRREVGATRSALETLFARKEQATGSAAAAGAALSPSGIASLGGRSEVSSRGARAAAEDRGAESQISSNSGAQPKGSPTLSQLPQELQALGERVAALELEQRATSSTAFARMDQIEARFAAELLEMQRQFRKSQEQQRAQATGSDVGSSHPVDATRSEDDNTSVRSLALSSQSRNNTDEIKSRLLEVRRHAEGLLSSSPTTRGPKGQGDLQRSLLEALAELPQTEPARARSEVSAPAGGSYQRANTEALINTRAEQLGAELRVDMCDRVNAAHVSLREDVVTAVERVRKELRPRLDALENGLRQLGLDPATAPGGGRARSPVPEDMPLLTMSTPVPPGAAKPKITRDMKESLSRLVTKVNHTLSVEPSTRASEVDDSSHSRQSSTVGSNVGSNVPRRQSKPEVTKGASGSLSGSRNVPDPGSAINDISSAIRALGVNSPEAKAQEALGVMRQHSAQAAARSPPGGIGRDVTPRGTAAMATPDVGDGFRNMVGGPPPAASRSPGRMSGGLGQNQMPPSPGASHLGQSSCGSSTGPGSLSTNVGPSSLARETLPEHTEAPSSGARSGLGSPSRGQGKLGGGPCSVRQQGSLATPCGAGGGGNGLDGSGRASSPIRPGQQFGQQRPLLSPAGLGGGTSMASQQPSSVPASPAIGMYHNTRSPGSSNLSHGGGRSPVQNPYAARR